MWPSAPSVGRRDGFVRRACHENRIVQAAVQAAWRAPRGRWYGRGTKTLYLHRRKYCSLDLSEQIDSKQFGRMGVASTCNLGD